MTLRQWEPLPPNITQIIRKPVICYCSGTQTHKVDHLVCRCDGYERLRKDPEARFYLKSIEHYQLPINCYDEDGFPLCRYCGKIPPWEGLLVTCPYCEKKFKGPRPWFPVNYECESCG